jgi:hypothetical protein
MRKTLQSDSSPIPRDYNVPIRQREGMPCCKKRSSKASIVRTGAKWFSQRKPIPKRRPFMPENGLFQMKHFLIHAVFSPFVLVYPAET